MPISRTPSSNNWISRKTEEDLFNLLNQNRPLVVPVIGGGGAGKTSLLRRFMDHCLRNGIPALYLDLPRLTISGTWDMLLQIEVVNAPEFEKQRKKLHASYENLTAMMQAHGKYAASAAELLQKSIGKDESLGLVVGSIVGGGKLLHNFWQREENRQHKELLQNPEESLLRAFAEDCTSKGVILVDTLEQSGKEKLLTRLQFLDTGEIETMPGDKTQSITLLDYCAGMAHFLFDNPVLMVLAGRPPAIRDLGALPVDFFASTIEIPAFNQIEIREYVENSLPRKITSPHDTDIEKLRQLTHGNPLLLERVVRLMSDWQPLWEWKDDQWQPLFDCYRRDERFGLLLYVTQRLLTHVLPDDRAFWRLSLPRQYVHREMAELLFPKSEFPENFGLARLLTYEDNGILYRQVQDPDRFLLHDESRAAFEAWAKHENCWLDVGASEIHNRLALWFDQQSHWPEQYPEPNSDAVENSNPLLLEGAYHKVVADYRFEQRYLNLNRQHFWQVLSTSLAVTNAGKMEVAAALPGLSPQQVEELTKVFQDEFHEFGKFLTPAAQKWLNELSSKGELPSGWLQNEGFLLKACTFFPDEPLFLGHTAVFMQGHGDMDGAEALYRRACEISTGNADILGWYARFMQTVRSDYERAEALYEQALAVRPNHPHNLGYFASFMHGIRKDYDRAEMLYRQALIADTAHARNLGWFAYFMESVREDYEAAESLYEQAINADPSNANTLGRYASFMEFIRQNYDRAESLYHQAIAAAPDHARNLGSFAIFMHSARKDYDKAEALYRQSIDLDSCDANLLGNLAQILLAKGNHKEGRETLTKSLSLTPLDPALKLELLFYCLAHFPEDYPEARAEIMALLAAGSRSEGWDFSANIRQSATSEHNDSEWLQTLADVITGKSALDSLAIPAFTLQGN